MSILNIEDPKWSIITLGEGSMCELRSRRFEMVQGIAGYWYLMRPYAMTAKKYGLVRGETMTNEGFIDRWYPDSEVFALNSSPVNGRWLCNLDLNGTETPFSEREAYYTGIINSLNQRKAILQSENAMLYEKLTKMTAKFSVFMKDEVELMKLIMQVRGNINKKEDDSDYKED